MAGRINKSDERKSAAAGTDSASSAAPRLAGIVMTPADKQRQAQNAITEIDKAISDYFDTRHKVKEIPIDKKPKYLKKIKSEIDERTTNNLSFTEALYNIFELAKEALAKPPSGFNRLFGGSRPPENTEVYEKIKALAVKGLNIRGKKLEPDNELKEGPSL